MSSASKALLCLLSAVFMFEMVGVFTKLTHEVPLYTIVFCRSFFALLPLGLGWWWLKLGAAGLKPRAPKLHLARGVVGFATMLCNFYAIQQLPIATVTALQLTMPFFMMLLAALWLKEKLQIHQIAALLVGFLGAVVMAKPIVGSSDVAMQAIMAAIASAFLGATSGVMIRKLNIGAKDPPLLIALSYSALCAFFTLFLLPFGGAWPEGMNLVYLIGAGCAGGVAQLLLTLAYRYATVKAIAPYEYSSLLWAGLFGYVLWGDKPTLAMLCGVGLILLADMLNFYYEKKSKPAE